MAKETNISWTDSTWNPWWGCQKVSPGCDNCYAEGVDKRTGDSHWGPGVSRRRTSVKNWGDPIRWNAKAEKFFAENGRRQRVFCASMGDIFDNAVPIEWFVDALEVIRLTPNLDWQLLTKRIGNVLPRLREAKAVIDFEARRDLWLWVKTWESGLEVPDNVWLGASIVNQEEADRDIVKLLNTPAKVRFLSMEPLLSAVDLSSWLGLTIAVDWVIVGGESGAAARPMNPSWVVDLKDQCKEHGVAFFFKQWGEWTPVTLLPVDGRLRSHSFDDGNSVVRVGVRAAGDRLDSVAYNNWPAVSAGEIV